MGFHVSLGECIITVITAIAVSIVILLLFLFLL